MGDGETVLTTRQRSNDVINAASFARLTIGLPSSFTLSYRVAHLHRLTFHAEPSNDDRPRCRTRDEVRAAPLTTLHYTS